MEDFTFPQLTFRSERQPELRGEAVLDSLFHAWFHTWPPTRRCHHDSAFTLHDDEPRALGLEALHLGDFYWRRHIQEV